MKHKYENMISVEDKSSYQRQSQGYLVSQCDNTDDTKKHKYENCEYVVEDESSRKTQCEVDYAWMKSLRCNPKKKLPSAWVSPDGDYPYDHGEDIDTVKVPRFPPSEVLSHPPSPHFRSHFGRPAIGSQLNLLLTQDPSNFSCASSAQETRLGLVSELPPPTYRSMVIEAQEPQGNIQRQITSRLRTSPRMSRPVSREQSSPKDLFVAPTSLRGSDKYSQSVSKFTQESEKSRISSPTVKQDFNGNDSHDNMFPKFIDFLDLIGLFKEPEALMEDTKFLNIPQEVQEAIRSSLQQDETDNNPYMSTFETQDLDQTPRHQQKRPTEVRPTSSFKFPSKGKARVFSLSSKGADANVYRFKGSNSDLSRSHQLSSLSKKHQPAPSEVSIHKIFGSQGINASLLKKSMKVMHQAEPPSTSAQLSTKEQTEDAFFNDHASHGSSSRSLDLTNLAFNSKNSFSSSHAASVLAVGNLDGNITFPSIVTSKTSTGIVHDTGPFIKQIICVVLGARKERKLHSNGGEISKKTNNQKTTQASKVLKQRTLKKVSILEAKKEKTHALKGKNMKKQDDPHNANPLRNFRKANHEMFVKKQHKLFNINRLKNLKQVEHGNDLEEQAESLNMHQPKNVRQAEPDKNTKHDVNIVNHTQTNAVQTIKTLSSDGQKFKPRIRTYLQSYILKSGVKLPIYDGYLQQYYIQKLEEKMTKAHDEPMPEDVITSRTPIVSCKKGHHTMLKIRTDSSEQRLFDSSVLIESIATQTSSMVPLNRQEILQSDSQKNSNDMRSANEQNLGTLSKELNDVMTPPNESFTTELNNKRLSRSGSLVETRKPITELLFQYEELKNYIDIVFQNFVLRGSMPENRPTTTQTSTSEIRLATDANCGGDNQLLKSSKDQLLDSYENKLQNPLMVDAVIQTPIEDPQQKNSHIGIAQPKSTVSQDTIGLQLDGAQKYTIESSDQFGKSSHSFLSAQEQQQTQKDSSPCSGQPKSMSSQDIAMSSDQSRRPSGSSLVPKVKPDWNSSIVITAKPRRSNAIFCSSREAPMTPKRQSQSYTKTQKSWESVSYTEVVKSWEKSTNSGTQHFSNNDLGSGSNLEDPAQAASSLSAFVGPESIIFNSTSETKVLDLCKSNPETTTFVTASITSAPVLVTFATPEPAMEDDALELFESRGWNQRRSSLPESDELWDDPFEIQNNVRRKSTGQIKISATPFENYFKSWSRKPELSLSEIVPLSDSNLETTNSAIASITSAPVLVTSATLESAIEDDALELFKGRGCNQRRSSLPESNQLCDDPFEIQNNARRMSTGQINISVTPSDNYFKSWSRRSELSLSEIVPLSESSPETNTFDIASITSASLAVTSATLEPASEDALQLSKNRGWNQRKSSLPESNQLCDDSSHIQNNARRMSTGQIKDSVTFSKNFFKSWFRKLELSLSGIVSFSESDPKTNTSDIASITSAPLAVTSATLEPTTEDALQLPKSRGWNQKRSSLTESNQLHDDPSNIQNNARRMSTGQIKFSVTPSENNNKSWFRKPEFSLSRIVPFLTSAETSITNTEGLNTILDSDTDSAFTSTISGQSNFQDVNSDSSTFVKLINLQVSEETTTTTFYSSMSDGFNVDNTTEMSSEAPVVLSSSWAETEQSIYLDQSPYSPTIIRTNLELSSPSVNVDEIEAATSFAAETFAPREVSNQKFIRRPSYVESKQSAASQMSSSFYIDDRNENAAYSFKTDSSDYMTTPANNTWVRRRTSIAPMELQSFLPSHAISTQGHTDPAVNQEEQSFSRRISLIHPEDLRTTSPSNANDTEGVSITDIRSSDADSPDFTSKTDTTLNPTEILTSVGVGVSLTPDSKSFPGNINTTPETPHEEPIPYQNLSSEEIDVSLASNFDSSVGTADNLLSKSLEGTDYMDPNTTRNLESMETAVSHTYATTSCVAPSTVFIQRAKNDDAEAPPPKAQLDVFHEHVKSDASTIYATPEGTLANSLATNTKVTSSNTKPQDTNSTCKPPQSPKSGYIHPCIACIAANERMSKPPRYPRVEEDEDENVYLGELLKRSFNPRPGDVMIVRKKMKHHLKDGGYVCFYSSQHERYNWCVGDFILRSGKFHRSNKWNVINRCKLYQRTHDEHWMLVGLVERPDHMLPLVMKEELVHTQSRSISFVPRRGDFIVRMRSLEVPSQLEAWTCKMKINPGDILARVYVGDVGLRCDRKEVLEGQVELYVYGGKCISWIFMGRDICKFRDGHDLETESGM